MRAAMWKLHRYYLKELAINAAITFSVLFAIVLISLVARGIQRAQGGGLLDAALITIFFAMDAFPHLLTISFLMATVLTFARATQDREMVAIRSAGISPVVPMTSALLLGLVLAIVGALTMHYALPMAHFRKYRVGVEVARNLILSMNLSSDRMSIPNTDIVWTCRERNAAQEYLDCTIWLPDDDLGVAGVVSPVLRVDKVSIPRPDERSESLLIRLEGVRDPVTGNRLAEWTIDLPLRSLTEGRRRAEDDRDLTSDQLLSEVYRDVHDQPNGAMFTVHRRTSFALLPAILAPIGFCIALLSRDRGRVAAMVFGLLPLGAFYGADVLGFRLLRATDSPYAGWTPVAALLLLGLPFCWRVLRR